MDTFSHISDDFRPLPHHDRHFFEQHIDELALRLSHCTDPAQLAAMKEQIRWLTEHWHQVYVHTQQLSRGDLQHLIGLREERLVPLVRSLELRLLLGD